MYEVAYLAQQTNWMIEGRGRLDLLSDVAAKLGTAATVRGRRRRWY